jgi:hypothetical protein
LKPIKLYGLNIINKEKIKIITMKLEKMLMVLIKTEKIKMDLTFKDKIKTNSKGMDIMI